MNPVTEQIQPDPEDLAAAADTPRRPGQSQHEYDADRYRLAQAAKLVRLYGPDATAKIARITTMSDIDPEAYLETFALECRELAVEALAQAKGDVDRAQERFWALLQENDHLVVNFISKVAAAPGSDREP
jgi:hypothetical protein